MGGGVNNGAIIERYLPWIDTDTVGFLACAVAAIMTAKNKGHKVLVAAGSGPHLHGCKADSAVES